MSFGIVEILNILAKGKKIDECTSRVAYEDLRRHLLMINNNSTAFMRASILLIGVPPLEYICRVPPPPVSYIMHQ